jgi:hypothetical protein
VTISVHARTKLTAALMAAGVVAAAPIVTNAGPEVSQTISNIAVRPTSQVTDALYGLWTVVDSATWGVAIPIDAGIAVPLEAIYSAVATAQDPSRIGSAISYLANKYLNPADFDHYPYYTYPWAIKTSSLLPLVSLLPASSAASLTDGINNVSNSISDALSALPDPSPVVDAIDEFTVNNLVGQAVRATQLLVLAPVYSIGNTISWLAYFPAEIEASVESAIQNPSEIPGLVSYLASDVAGTLDGVVYPFATAGIAAPAPIGGADGLADRVYHGFVDGLNNLLAALPTPVTPTPFATSASAMLAKATAAAAPSAAVTDEPAATIARVLPAAAAPEEASANSGIAAVMEVQGGESTPNSVGAPKPTPSEDVSAAPRTDADPATDKKTTADDKKTTAHDKKATAAESDNAKVGDHTSAPAPKTSTRPRHAKADDSEGAVGSSAKPRHAKADDGGSAHAGSSQAAA